MKLYNRHCNDKTSMSIHTKEGFKSTFYHTKRIKKRKFHHNSEGIHVCLSQNKKRVQVLKNLFKKE